MQTLYFTTNSFVRSEGNVVDFTDYRRRLHPCAQEENDLWEDASYEVLDEEWEYARHPRRAERLFSLSNLPDLCAAAAIVVFTVTAIFRFLQF